ncbi:hypothetical protein B0H14DRAFT_2601176 [Mycena olivaceomarginata]|nr:hypothetical protein B0H14DRAFT_2601176 [Mycena olivaceomarginata]
MSPPPAPPPRKLSFKTEQDYRRYLQRLEDYRNYRARHREKCRAQGRQRMARLRKKATDEQRAHHREAQARYREKNREWLAHKARLAAREKNAAAGENNQGAAQGTPLLLMTRRIQPLLLLLAFNVGKILLVLPVQNDRPGRRLICLESFAETTVFRFAVRFGDARVRGEPGGTGCPALAIAPAGAASPGTEGVGLCGDGVRMQEALKVGWVAHSTSDGSDSGGACQFGDPRVALLDGRHYGVAPAPLENQALRINGVARPTPTNLPLEDLQMDNRGIKDPRYYCLPPFRGDRKTAGVSEARIEAKASLTGYPDSNHQGCKTEEECIEVWQRLCVLGVHPHPVDPSFFQPPSENALVFVNLSPRKSHASSSANVKQEDTTPSPTKAARPSGSKGGAFVNYAIRGDGVISSSAERSEQRYLEAQRRGEEPDLLITRSFAQASLFALDDEDCDAEN